MITDQEYNEKSFELKFKFVIEVMKELRPDLYNSLNEKLRELDEAYNTKKLKLDCDGLIDFSGPSIFK